MYDGPKAPKSKRSFLQDNFPHLMGKKDAEPMDMEADMPPPEEIDKAIMAKAGEVDSIEEELSADEGSGEIPEPRILRLLTRFGPPEEWTPSDRMTIGKENCDEMEKAWAAMHPIEQGKVRAKFEASKEGGMNEEMKKPGEGKERSGMMPMGAAVTLE